MEEEEEKEKRLNGGETFKGVKIKDLHSHSLVAFIYLKGLITSTTKLSCCSTFYRSFGLWIWPFNFILSWGLYLLPFFTMFSSSFGLLRSLVFPHCSEAGSRLLFVIVMGLFHGFFHPNSIQSFLSFWANLSWLSQFSYLEY